ncbi:unnamed protein product [Rhizophagus irregularis]|nr:unnamed protein product [Rhizophagus irregularis]
MLEQEKPGYIEKHGPQWMHIYEGRIKPLCNDIIKSQRCDKAKDICTTMFDIFAFECLFKTDEEGNLLYIQAIKNKAWVKRKQVKRIQLLP